MSNSVVAFDKASARTVDAQGFLHIAGCNISKETVNPYMGSEIPNWKSFNLDPTKIYAIYRPGEELAKAARTFDNLPLLDGHVEVGAVDLEDPAIKARIVGSTGQTARFNGPYLTNDLAIWTAGAIAGVDSKEQTELSCAYRYTIDMTPGVFNGTPYDGKMVDIIGNHVALVEQGRAGHDVVVKDAAMSVAKDSAAMEVLSKLTGIKAQLKEVKADADDEQTEILDDCASSIDIAMHHLLDYEEKTLMSVTRDDNPEGINQYTGGGGKSEAEKMPGERYSKSRVSATKASSKANQTGSKKDHELAANAHRLASLLSSNKGNETYHRQNERLHSGFASSAQDSITAEDDNPEGINQYTGGGGGGGSKEKADKATQNAEEATAATKVRIFGTSRSRQEQRAANAHEIAAKEQHRAATEATPEKQKEHLAQRDKHYEAQRYHQERANAMMSVGDSMSITEEEDTTARDEAEKKQVNIGEHAERGATAHDSQGVPMGKHKGKQLTPQGHVVRGALLTYLPPRLAADKALQPGEIESILRNVTPDKYERQVPGIVGTVMEKFKDRLAADASLEDLAAILNALQAAGQILDGTAGEGLEGPEGVEAGLPEGEEADALPPTLEGQEESGEMPKEAAGQKLMEILSRLQLPEEELSTINELINVLAKAEAPKPAAPPKANPFPPKKPGEAMEPQPITKPAMDEAIAENSKNVRAEISARYMAGKEVAPIVGEVDVMALDSVAAIYKLALDEKKIDVAGVDPSAYRALVKMIPREVENAPMLAADAAAIDELHKKYPHTPGKA